MTLSAKAFSCHLSRQLGIELLLDDADRPLLRLLHLKVPVAERGRGVGSKALEYVKKFADQAGNDVVLVAVSRTPELKRRLERFYERNGFERLSPLNDQHAAYVYRGAWQCQNGCRPAPSVNISSRSAAPSRAGRC